MTEPSLTILPETADDAVAIERLHERTFGPGRYAKSAYRLREGIGHQLELSFTARIGTLLVGSVRLSPIRIGETQGAAARAAHGRAAVPRARHRSCPDRACARGARRRRGTGWSSWWATSPTTAKRGFKRIPKGSVTMPGPVDPARLLVCELADGAFEGVSGPIRPDWTAA